MQRTLGLRIATFLIWLAAAASAVFWALRFVSSPAAPASAAMASAPQGAGAVDASALAKGLGGSQTAPQESAKQAAAPSAFQATRFVLTGVVVSRNAPGVALLAVDGKPPRPYRVGAQLADGIVLHSVSPGHAMLSTSADTPPGLTLALPRQTSAVVGTAVAARPTIAAPQNPASAFKPAATPLASAMSGLAQKPARLGANREPEAERATGAVN